MLLILIMISGRGMSRTCYAVVTEAASTLLPPALARDQFLDS
jgi:hypothetical protein